MLELESPKHFKSDTILIPPKFNINLKANLADVTYQVDSASNNIVKVTRDGILKSSDTIGRDLIIVRKFSAHNAQKSIEFFFPL